MAFALAPVAAEADPGAPIEIIVPAQPLASAIGRLSEQTDISIYAPQYLLAGKTSAPVDNALSAKAALETMLKDTGLSFAVSQSGAFIIRTQEPEPGSEKIAAAPPDAAGDEIVVVGAYAAGLGRSLDIKRGAGGIVDAIVAADIGKLPAVNVAEALQRLPGVTVSREAGEGEFVGVRGLGPNFQSVTFNGVPIAVNENIRNSDQSGRQFRFRVLPADLIGGVIVTKSPAADMIDGGIGANIDIATVKPLDRGTFASARAFASADQRAGQATPNGSMAAGWANAAHTLGLIGGVSFQRRDVQFDRLQNFGYETHDVGGYEDVEVAGGWSTTVEQEKRRRMSFLGGLQWRPNDKAQVHAELLYANFNNEIAENRVSYELGGLAAEKLEPGSARVEDGVLVAGAIRGGVIDRNAEYSEQTHENLTFRLAGDAAVSGWTISPSFSLSEATSRLGLPLQRIEARTIDNDDLLYRFDLGSDPVESVAIRSLGANIDLTDPDAAPFRRYRIRPISSRDRDATGLLDISRPLAASLAGVRLTRFQAGAQYTERFRDYQRRDRTLTLKDGFAVDASYYDYAIPAGAFDGLIAERSLWVGPNLDAFRTAFEVAGEYDGVDPQPEDLEPTSDDLRQSYRIEEDIVALYGRLDFESAVRGAPVSGNVGLRWVRTDMTVFGAAVEARSDLSGAVEIVSAPRATQSAYAELLPSLNIRFDLSEGVVLRLGGSRSLTRPSLASLRDATVPSSATVSEIYERGAVALDDPNLDVTAVGGNPNLKPYVSANADASLEWYFDPFGALTVSAFYKRIDDFIYGEMRLEPMPFAVHDGSAVVVDINVNRPQNNGVASLAGVEMGYARRLPSGLGLSASAAFTSSTVELEYRDGSRQSARLQGVSEVSYSITPYFQRGPIEAYVSYTWRSAFDSNGNVTIASDAKTDVSNAIIAADFGTLDFGASCHVNRRFDIFAEGVNMTDARQAAYQGYESRLYQLHQYGRTINIGLRARF